MNPLNFNTAGTQQIDKHHELSWFRSEPVQQVLQVLGDEIEHLYESSLGYEAPFSLYSAAVYSSKNSPSRKYLIELRGEMQDKERCIRLEQLYHEGVLGGHPIHQARTIPHSPKIIAKTCLDDHLPQKDHISSFSPFGKKEWEAIITYEYPPFEQRSLHTEVRLYDDAQFRSQHTKQFVHHGIVRNLSQSGMDIPPMEEPAWYRIARVQEGKRYTPKFFDSLVPLKEPWNLEDETFSSLRLRIPLIRNQSSYYLGNRTEVIPIR